MYATMYTRSNIYFAFERFNQYFNDLTKHYEQVLKQLFRYIRFIIDLEIKYETFENNESTFFNFKIFSNFDYATNKLNRKSILKYIYIFVKKSIS